MSLFFQCRSCKISGDVFVTAVKILQNIGDVFVTSVKILQNNVDVFVISIDLANHR